MENPNLEDTSPIHIPHEPQSPADPGETLPVSVEHDPAETGSFDETVRMQIRPAESAAEDDAATMPVQVHADIPEPPVPSEPVSPPPAGRKPLSLRSWSLLGVLGLLAVALLSAFGGYNSGISQRKSAQATQVAVVVDEQFLLGVQDMEAQRFDLARQRFEYVIRLDPGYPGVTDKLSDVLLFMNTTATPTPVPTPTLTPTPDLRGVQELFSQAQEDLSNQDWQTAIGTLLTLRKADPAYQAVWVDDMLFISFRNQGVDKILRRGDLEGGIYDVTVAEQYGPLDTDAKGYLTWARLYITGASFWEIDWAQAVYYFGQVGPALPNLRDGSGWTAAERYRLALIGYGGFLADSGQCEEAGAQFELAATYGVDDTYQQAYDKAVETCGGGGDNEEKKNKDNQDNQEATDVPVTTETPPDPGSTPYP